MNAYVDEASLDSSLSTAKDGYDYLINPQRLLCGIQAAAAAVVEQKEQLNQINFFPVSDKDTGSNLACTLQQIAEIPRYLDSISQVLRVASEVIFENACGNSGVIFSIWFTGLEAYRMDKPDFLLSDLLLLIAHGVNYLSDSMDNIVAGTMVSFLQNFSKSVFVCKHYADVCFLIDHCLAETKIQNPVLLQHDVVDAGALGVAIFLKHLFQAMFVNEVLFVTEKPHKTYAMLKDITHHPVTESPQYRYCTQAKIEVRSVDFNMQHLKIKAILEQFGDCDLLAKRGRKLNFHVHTNNPQQLFTYLYKLGTVTQPKVEDMLRQYQASQRHTPIALVTDSSADIDPHLIEKYQIHILPLSLSFDNHEALDPYTVDKSLFYEDLDAFSIYPKTASPHLKRTYSLLAYLEKYYEKILVITISSNMSASYQSLVTLSKRFSNVYVLDSLTNSGAHGFLVRQAAELIHDKYAFHDIIKKLKAYRKNVFIYVAVSSLSSMIRSGRVTGLKAQLLRIKKPKLIISIDEQGKSVVCEKIWSKINVIDRLVHMAAENYRQRSFKRYCVLHVNDKPQAEYFAEKLFQLIQMKPSYIDCVSSVIGVHAGQGAVAIAFDRGD